MRSYLAVGMTVGLLLSTGLAESRHKKVTVKKAVARNAQNQNGSRSRRSHQPRQSTPSAERYSEIQQVLAEKGFYTGPVTGVWGTESVEALRKFQSDQKLAPDGKLGARSLIALGLGPQRQPLGDFTGKSEVSR